MELNLIKIIGGILLWLSMVVFGLLPIYYTKFRTSARLMSLCNCFSGGLFIAIGLVHILPEAHELLDETMKAVVYKQAPENDTNVAGCGADGIQWSYLICLLSFSSIMFLDKVLFNNNDLIAENQTGGVDLRKSALNDGLLNGSMNDEHTIEDNFKERISGKFKIALKLSKQSGCNLKGSFGKNEEIDDEDFDCTESEIIKPNYKIIKTYEEIDEEESNDPAYKKLVEPLLEKTQKERESELLEIQNQKNKKKVINLSQNPEDVKIMISNKDKKSNINDFEHEEHEGHVHQVLVGKGDSTLTCIILLIAMGIHGFFSLLAFGIENDKASAINLFIALIVHKWSEALTVGKHYLF